VGGGQRVAVIGAGFGGLAAAVRLAAAGRRVQLFEKRDRLGGRGYPLAMDGFRFDSGPTVITAPHLFEELWALAGRRFSDDVELLPIDPFYRIFDQAGGHLDYRRDPEAMIGEIERRAPRDVDGYRRLVRETVRIFESFYPHTDRPFLQPTEMLGLFPNVIRHGLYRSMYGFVSRYVRDPFLREALSFHPLLVGGNPLATPAMFGLIAQFEREWGVHYPRGGTASIVDAFGRLLDALGVEVHLETEVTRIDVRNGRAAGVELQDGTFHPADVVVCNSDLAWAHERLLPPVPRSAGAWWRRRMKYSNSLVVVYFGTRGTYAESELLHHNLLLGRDYHGQMRDIFDRGRMPADLSLYLHMPTRTDPTVAPDGHGSFYVLALVPNLDGGDDWGARGDAYRDRIIETLERRFLPGLAANIVVEHRIDPPHFRDTLNSYKGAAFAAQPRLFQSAWLRPHNRSDSVRDLYFVGAGTHPGAGVPAVLSSGKIAARLILEGTA
jgi:phytoene desaturase